MSKSERLKEAVAQNPRVETPKVEQVLRAVEQLREAGMQPRGYQLQSPFRGTTKVPDTARSRTAREIYSSKLTDTA